MRIAVLGRTRWLIDVADMVSSMGHDVVAVATARAEPMYQCDVEDYRALAQRTGADFLGECSLADPSVQSRLASAQAEVAVSINWPTLVGHEVMDIFRLGVINAHCGDLPRYRGNACPNWAILNGETRIGLCAHMMEPEHLDAGAILTKDYLPISEETYIGDVYAWLDRRVPSLLAAAVAGLASGALVPVPQPSDPSLALRCYPRRPDDGRLVWNHDVEIVYRLVRASSRPFSGAFTYLDDGRKLTIWRARPYSHPSPFCAVPGQVLLRESGDPVIACGRGALRLEEIEVEGEPVAIAKSIVARSLRSRLN